MGGAGHASSWLDLEGAGPAGDPWLAAVEANGGSAPPAVPMKPFLAKQPDGKYSLSLADEDPSPSKKARAE